MDVAYSGVCEEDLVRCDGPGDCARSEYCSFGEENTCGASGPGICLPRPPDCSRLLEPHCGCDGVTYTNACRAHRDGGVDVAFPGECPVPTCRDNSECDGTEYCFFDHTIDACGADGLEPGVCLPRSDCSPQLVFVCGCDGQQYTDPCTAAARGVNIASIGLCPTDPGPEGCRTNSDCSRGEYCFFDPSEDPCGERGTQGTCEPVPRQCLLPVIAPVCGCDGTVYDNACEASREGVNVRASGECEPSVGTCSSSQDCRTSQYCAFPDSDACGEAGTLGRCTTRPLACRPGDPAVCGCDGTQYDNACEAARIGQVDYRFEGRCPAEPEPEGCRSNEDCSRSEFCDFPPAAACGSRGTGTCEPVPERCDPAIGFVCGCDGRTYLSACEANRNRVSATTSTACNSFPPF